MTMMTKTDLPVWRSAIDHLPYMGSKKQSKDLVIRKIYDDGSIEICIGAYVDTSVGHNRVNDVDKYWLDVHKEEVSLDMIDGKLVQNFAVTHYMVIK